MKKSSTGKRSKYERAAERLLRRMDAGGEWPLYHGGRLLTWTGRRYTPVDDADLYVRRWLRRVGIPQTNALVANVVPILRALLAGAGDDPPLPSWRGAAAGTPDRPDPRNVVAFRNGLLDTGRPDAHLLPHTPEWVSLNCLEFDFETTADCPHWLTFLDQVYEGDPARVALLQEWAGYLMTGDASAQKLLLLTGKGRSGKGTICSVLADLVGPTNATGYDLGELTTSFGLTALRGKLAAFVPEVELAGRGDRAVIVERLKAIVGQDPVVINLKYRDPVSERLGVRFTVAANTLPALADASGALAARVLAIEHRVSFAGREDFGLLDRLRAERPGIARWALDGLARLRANGRRFTGGRLTDAVSRKLAVQSAPVRVFARERLVVQAGYEAGESGLTVSDQPVQVGKADLYTAYSLWAEANDLTPTSLNWVVRDLKTLLPGLENVRPTGPHGTRYNALAGVALRVVSPDAVPGPLGE